MNTDYLKSFLAVVDTGSFTLAAEQLYTSQSVVSRQIKALEKELNVTLINRTTRKTSISEAGIRLLPHIKEIIDSEEELTKTINILKSEKSNKLIIGSLPVIHQYGISKFILDFSKPRNISSQIVEFNDTDILQPLLDKEFELAFWGDEIEYKDIEKIQIIEDKLVVALPIDHPLANEEVVSLKDLKDESFCMTAKRTPFYTASYNTCIRAGFIPNIYFTFVRPENAIDLVAEDNCVALVLKGYVNRLKDERIIIKDITPVTNRKISLIRLKNRPLSQHSQEFWNYMKQQKVLFL